MHEEKGSNFMEGLLIGGLIGAAVGVLFAPLSGDKSRAAIKEKLKELDLDDLIDRFSEALAEAKQAAGNVRDDLGRGE